MTRILTAVLILAGFSGVDGATSASDKEGVTNVAHRILDDQIVVSYDIAGKHRYSVELHVLRQGRPFRYKARAVSGDVGADVVAGTRRQIVWSALSDLPELEGNGWIFEVRASRPANRARLYAAGALVGLGVVVAGTTLGGSGGTGTILIELPDPED